MKDFFCQWRGEDAAGDYAAVYKRAICPSLLQHPLYARSYGMQIGHSPRYGFVYGGGVLRAGLLGLEARYMGAIFHSILLDMGPVWGEGSFDTSYEKMLFAALGRDFPARIGRRRRFIPASGSPLYTGAAGSDDARALQEAGWRRRAGGGADTIWCDVSVPPVMRKNWAAQVRRAEEAGLTVQWDDTGRFLPWLLAHEGAARRGKGYRAIAPAVLKRMARLAGEDKAGDYGGGAVLTGRVLDAGKPVAGAAFVCHEPAATYVLAWTGDAGRGLGAQNILLRDVYAVLKARGIRYLDLGGVNDTTARGVTYFKSGLKGSVHAQAGLYS